MRSVSLAEGAYAIGRSLSEVLGEEQGVEVTSIRRRNIMSLEPTEETCFEGDDVVVLLGVPGALAVAEDRLLKG